MVISRSPAEGPGGAWKLAVPPLCGSRSPHLEEGLGLPSAEIPFSPTQRHRPRTSGPSLSGGRGADAALTLSAGRGSHKPEREDVVAETALQRGSGRGCRTARSGAQWTGFWTGGGRGGLGPGPTSAAGPWRLVPTFPFTELSPGSSVG